MQHNSTWPLQWVPSPCSTVAHAWLQIDQLTVNEYTPGVGISPHIDTHSAFTGAIVCLSLGGPAVMVLRKEGEPAQQRAVALPPRSLLVLGQEARYAW